MGARSIQVLDEWLHRSRAVTDLVQIDAVERAARLVKDARLHILQGETKWVPVEHPAKVANPLVAFLKDTQQEVARHSALLQRSHSMIGNFSQKMD